MQIRRCRQQRHQHHRQTTLQEPGGCCQSAINPVDGSPYSATDDANVHRFQKELEALGVNATVRRRLGTDISAACGQLRREDAQGK